MTTLVPATTPQNATTLNTVPRTITLQSLVSLIPLSQYWISEQDTLAQRTIRYRRYYDGDHDIKLTKEMTDILQDTGADGSLAINLMPSVVDTKVDRCVVQSIEGVEEAPQTPEPPIDDTAVPKPVTPAAPVKEVGPNKPTKWAQEVADLNYFDILQGDVAEATIRDGNGYVMVGWDNEKQQIRMTFEPAWDGQTGMLIVYRSHNIPEPYAAIKVWQIEGETQAETTNLSVITRVNIYYKDKIEKYQSIDGGAFVSFIDKGKATHEYTWTMTDGTAIGLPVVHFRNAGRENYGVSELRNAISSQNALNRFNYSSIVATELTAFAIYKALGFAMETPVITPGVIIKMTKPIPRDQQVEFDKIPPSEITPIIDMMTNARKLLSEITRTPSPDIASSSNTSGEYLKQLEVGLVSKCRRYMTRAGQSWEQIFDLAWNIQQTYGKEKPPAYKRFFCRWKSPEVRNDAVEVQNATALEPIWGARQTLRAIGPIYDLDEEKIDKLMEEKKQDTPVQMQLPGMPGQPPNGPQQPGNKQQPGDKQNANITPEQAAQWNQMFSEMKKSMSNAKSAAA
jgi:hypothetical protein